MKMRSLLSFIMAAILLLSLVSCGAANDAATDSDMPGYAYDKSENMSPELEYSKDDGFVSGSLDASTAVTDSARKRIQYVNISMESTEYDSSLTAIKTKCAELGGYIESSNEYGLDSSGRGSRSASITFRIPQENLNAFTSGVETAGNILSFTTDTDDVTESYYDIEARLASLEAQRDRYMALLEKAEKMEDILVIDSALTEVIYEIESYTGTLNKYDALVAYSTVNLNLREVVELTEAEPVDPTFGERIASAFLDSTESFVEMMQSIVVGVAAAMPFLIVPVIIVVVVIIVIRSNGKKKRKVEKTEE